METIECLFQFQTCLTSILGELFKPSWYFNIDLLIIRDVLMDKCSGKFALLGLQTS